MKIVNKKNVYIFFWKIEENPFPAINKCKYHLPDVYYTLYKHFIVFKHIFYGVLTQFLRIFLHSDCISLQLNAILICCGSVTGAARGERGRRFRGPIDRWRR